MDELIDPWLAIGFAVDNLQDDYGRLRFLRAIMEADYLTLTEEFPEFPL